MWWEAKLKITYNENTLKWMENQVLFWVGGQDRIDDEDGDVEKAYLKMLANFIIHESIEYNAYGIRAEIEKAEGWAALDERFGVELISVDTWSFQEDEFHFDTNPTQQEQP